MTQVLAIDAGGTSTRAVVVRSDGHCTGLGRAGSGNPIAVGAAGALDSVTRAATAAVAGSSPSFATAVIAMAGMSAMVNPETVRERLIAAGLDVAGVELDADLLAMFCSGTPELNGYALAAGTGSISARVVDGRLHRVGGGNGWLVGDVGSGFWLGHQVAGAVVAALDGLGPPTVLTELLLAEFGIATTEELVAGRPKSLVQLVSALYEALPTALSRYAPLAFTAGADPVAAGLRDRAAQALAELLEVVRVPEIDGPVVLGGSVIRAILAARTPALATVLQELDVTVVDDGVVGSAVLALRAVGITVTEQIFDRITADVAGLRAQAGGGL